MALVDCPDCGNQVSEAAAACPRCARPFRSQVQVAQHQASGTKTEKGSSTFVRGGLIATVAGMVSCLGGAVNHSDVGMRIGAPVFILGVVFYLVGKITK